MFKLKMFKFRMFKFSPLKLSHKTLDKEYKKKCLVSHLQQPRTCSQLDKVLGVEEEVKLMKVETF